MLKGINYDIGTPFRKDTLSRPTFDEKVVSKEIEIIRNELHCDAIRISGFDADRLITASEIALHQGLEVWLSPAYIDAPQSEALKYLDKCAKAAETLRKKYGNIIFVAGCEYSIFLKGFVKGETIYDRIKTMFRPFNVVYHHILGFNARYQKQLNSFLNEAVSGIREHFKGKITYASGTWEKINWEIFDYVSIDHYRASYNKVFYEKELRNYYRFNKPVVVTEFGCCTYKGAEDKGGAGWAILEEHDHKTSVKGNYVRDEEVQANYIGELLDIFQKEKVEGAFVFTFVNPSFLHNIDPRYDLDMASYSIVKTIGDTGDEPYNELPWAPKKAFYRLQEYYREKDL